MDVTQEQLDSIFSLTELEDVAIALTGQDEEGHQYYRAEDVDPEKWEQAWADYREETYGA